MAFAINIGGYLLDLSTPQVMSVINMTPDSFYANSRQNSTSVLKAAQEAIEDGASILDIGGCSTRPGSQPPDIEEEYKRIRPAFRAIRSSFPTFPLSLDTYHSEIVRRIFDEFGPVLVNDVSAGVDPDMFPLISNYHLPYVLCHNEDLPGTIGRSAIEGNIADGMLQFFCQRIALLSNAGDIIIDPNFGFMKDTEQNLSVVREFDKFRCLGFPLMAGISRKRFVCQTAGCSTDEVLSATSALHMTLLEKGARLLRVHDTKAAVSTIKLFNALI